jgi:hypothetical protein
MATDSEHLTHHSAGQQFTHISVYCFDADTEVNVRMNNAHLQCGFSLPADLARQLGQALIARAATAEANRAREAA